MCMNRYYFFFFKVVAQKIQINLLGSKDLGINVFRTLMCIVGKP